MTGLTARAVIERRAFTLDADLSVPDGQTVAVLGPNGAGKSTLLAAIAGLAPIDSGRIVLDDVVLDDPDAGVFVPPEERRIGVVFQDGLLFPHMSVRQNVAFGVRSGPAADRQAIVDDWLDRLGLTELADRQAPSLSGGQAQRVALARALAPDPRLLLLDEPMSALDVSGRAEARAVLADHLEGFTGPRVLVTHEPSEAFGLADRIVILDRGSVSQRGTAAEIRRRPRTEYAGDLVGVNRYPGIADGGVVDVGGHRLTVPGAAHGAGMVTIHPRAVALHLVRPHGSARNAWQTTVTRVEDLGDRARVDLGPPVSVTAEITSASVAELGLESGAAVWVSIKATEIGWDPEIPASRRPNK